MCERNNSCRHGELVGPRLCRALVPEEDASGRTPRLVRAPFRIGRSELDVLFRARNATGRALVCSHAGRLHVRRKVAPTIFVSLNTGKAIAAGFAKERGDGRGREREIDTGFAGSDA